MPKVRITDSKGLIQEAGSGLDVETTMTLNHDMRYASTTLTANTTLKRGGLYLLSSSDTGLTITLPKANTVPGATFIFRATSTGSHALTCSQENREYFGLVGALTGTKSPANPERSNAGSKLTFPSPYGVSGSSAVLLCDGVNFMVLQSSGAFTVSNS